MLTLLVMLKSCGRLGYFPDPDEVPVAVTGHIRSVLELAPETPWSTARPGRQSATVPGYGGRLGLVRDPERVRRVAEEAMTAAAPVKAHTADLVNVALEEIVRAGLELPGFSTLDRMAATVRARAGQQQLDRSHGSV